MKFVLSKIIFLTLLLAGFANFASAEIDNFEELAAAYAEKEAVKCGAAVRFVDLYAEQKPEMEDKYNKYKIDVKFENMVYSSDIKTIDKPTTVYTADYKNDQSSRTITTEFVKRMQLKRSFTWKVTSKASIQNKLEVKVNLPANFEPLTTTLQMSGEAEKTVESTNTIEKRHIISVAPKTRVEATLTIIKQEMDIPWSADIVITGYFAFGLDKACGKESLKFVPVSALANSKFKWDPNRGLIYKTKGTFRSAVDEASINILEFNNDPKNKLKKKVGRAEA